VGEDTGREQEIDRLVVRGAWCELCGRLRC
jgi:hypothetical protein